MLTSQNKTLGDLISNLDAANVEILSESRRLTFEKIAPTNDGKETLPPNIAVCFWSNIDFIQALSLADGNTSNLLILSPTMDISTISDLIDASGSEAIYTDRTDLTDLSGLKSLESLRRCKKSHLQTRWLLATSGTTSKPKIVSHSFGSLTRTIAANAQGKNFVWGQLYDSGRFAGLQVLLQALSGHSKFVAPSTHIPLCKKLSLFAKEGVNALSATPTLWRKILMLEESNGLDLRSITLGGEIADQSILSALSTRFPSAKIRHIYASTEAGAGFSVSDGKAGFPVSYLTDAGNGIQIQVRDDVLFIQNSLVQGTYIGDDTSFVTNDGFVNTGDRVEIIEDRVIFKGRLSGVINVGGDKVYPETVEGQLNQVEGVKLSRVFGKKSPMVGQLTVCEIVIADGYEAKDVEKRLRAYAIENLAPYERPVMYKIVKEIPVSKSGKVKR